MGPIGSTMVCSAICRRVGKFFIRQAVCLLPGLELRYY